MANKIIRIGLLVCLAMASFGMLFVSMTETGFIEPISVLFLTTFLYFAFRFLYQKLSALTKRQLKIISILFLILSACLATAIIATVRIQVFGDIWHSQIMAGKLVDSNFEWDQWILQYPQLVPLTALYSWFMRLGAWLGIGFYPIFFTYNILLLVGILILIVRLLWRRSPVLGAFASILCLISPFFYSFIIQVGYTDGASIFALLLLVDLFDQAEQMNIWKLGLSTLIFAYAYLMRPNVIILLVALVIIAGFSFKKNKVLFHKASRLFLACLIGIVIAMSATKALDSAYHYNPQNNDAFPTVHWIYMGLNENSVGKYNRADRYYTLNHTGYATAKEADMAGIERRLEQCNPWTLVKQWVSKYMILWKSGSFQTLVDYQGSYIFAPAWLLEYNGVIILCLQMYSKALVGLLLLAIFADLWRKKQLKMDTEMLSLLIVFGISLFHALIWEVKSRYQFMTIGLLLFVGILALSRQFERQPNPVIADRAKKIGLLSFPVLLFVSSVLMIQYSGQKAPIQITGNNNGSNYNQSLPKITIPAHQSLRQSVQLNARALTMDMSLAPTANVTLNIYRDNAGDKDLIISRPITPLQTYLTLDNLSADGLASGNYVIEVSNRQDYPVSMTGQSKVYVSLYPSLIEQKKQTSSFVFHFYGDQIDGSYNKAFIITYVILSVLGALFLLLKKGKLS